MTEFTADDIETIKALILDHGCDCPSTDWEKVQALGEKLGCLDPVPVPTPEQLERDRLFRESPFGLQMSAMLKRSNEHLAVMLLEQKSIYDFTKDIAWGSKEIKPGDLLNIRLPDGDVKKVNIIKGEW